MYLVTAKTAADEEVSAMMFREDDTGLQPEQDPVELL